jgi:tetratricopeptide (TPR) repeat protein
MRGTDNNTSAADGLSGAMALHQQGRLEEAEREYAAFLRQTPRHPRALRLRGVLARERGALDDSLKWLRAAMQAAPDDAEPLCELAMTHVAAGELLRAETALRGAVALDGQSLKALANLGALLQYRGHIRECIDWHRQALELDESDVEVACNLAKALVEASQGEAALAACDAALDISPGDPLVLAARGAVLCDLGRYDEAITVLEQSLLRRPGDGMALVNLAYARQRLGQLTPAIAALRAALAASPDNAAADLANALAGQCRHADALGICERFLSRHPGERMVLAAYGFALADAGQNAEAAALFDYQRLACVVDVDVAPQGFASLGEFNRAIAGLVQSDPSLLQSPPSKATRGGSQTGELDLDRNAALRAWRAMINSALARVAAEYRENGLGQHPAMANAAGRWTLRAWGTILQAGGAQAPHIHPLGWLSGVYYAQLPPGMGTSGAEAGWLEFGTPPSRYFVRRAPAPHHVEPREGRLVIFPSYFYHRTRPFDCAGERISIAFDAVPRRA